MLFVIVKKKNPTVIIPGLDSWGNLRGPVGNQSLGGGAVFDCGIRLLQDTKTLFQLFDRDGNGRVSFDEFLEKLRVRISTGLPASMLS